MPDFPSGKFRADYNTARCGRFGRFPARAGPISPSQEARFPGCGDKRARTVSGRISPDLPQDRPSGSAWLSYSGGEGSYHRSRAVSAAYAGPCHGTSAHSRMLKGGACHTVQELRDRGPAVTAYPPVACALIDLERPRRNFITKV